MQEYKLFLLYRWGRAAFKAGEITKSVSNSRQSRWCNRLRFRDTGRRAL